nr:hypothetical protein [Halodesulfovibrio aestuarii]
MSHAKQPTSITRAGTATDTPVVYMNTQSAFFARITMLADVYDALCSKRCYKEPWHQERIFEYIMSERAKAFDPILVDIFTKHEKDIHQIRERYLNTPNFHQQNFLKN